jgi:hypothetical protein
MRRFQPGHRNAARTGTPRLEQAAGGIAGMLAKIPTCLILEESPALLGLAHLPLAG